MRIEIATPGQFHKLSRLDETQKRGAIFLAEGSADRRLPLHELVPEILVIHDRVKIGRQTQVMSVAREQLQAKAVDRTEEGVIKGGQQIE